MNRGGIFGGMKASHLLSSLCGAAVMLGLSTLRGSNAASPHHVYELRKELGRFPSRPGMAEGEGRIGGPRSTGGPYRPVFHGSDQLFSPELAHKLGRAGLAEPLRPIDQAEVDFMIRLKKLVRV